MGQNEIFRFLLDERKKSDKWFNMREIKEAFRKMGYSENHIKRIPHNVMRLAFYNGIQARGVGIFEGHHKEFRAYKNNG